MTTKCSNGCIIEGLSHIDSVKKVLASAFGKKTGEMSRTELIDSMYLLRAVGKVLENREKLVAEVLKNQMAKELEALTAEKPTMVVTGSAGNSFNAMRVWQKRLDTDRIKEEMGADWIETHQKEIDFIQFKSIKPGSTE